MAIPHDLRPDEAPRQSGIRRHNAATITNFGFAWLSIGSAAHRLGLLGAALTGLVDSESQNARKGAVSAVTRS